jgi:hypothetical protein
MSVFVRFDDRIIVYASSKVVEGRVDGRDRREGGEEGGTGGCV